MVTEEKGGSEEALADNRKRFANLLTLVEEGKVPGHTVAHRLKELEQEREKLEARLAQAPQDAKRLNLEEIKREVAGFALDFEQRFEKAPIEEKKDLVQRCISKVIVDKEKRVARFYVKKVPAGSPQLESLYEGNAAGSVMSDKCARNRDFESLTQISNLFELPI
jgi:hypothetical protein